MKYYILNKVAAKIFLVSACVFAVGFPASIYLPAFHPSLCLHATRLPETTYHGDWWTARLRTFWPNSELHIAVWCTSSYTTFFSARQILTLGKVEAQVEVESVGDTSVCHSKVSQELQATWTI